MTAVEGKQNVASKPGDMRLLVAFEDEYRAYGGAIASAFQVLRPCMRVKISGTDTLPRELARFAPQAVICSHPEGAVTDGRIAWVELPPEPDQTGRARLGDRSFEVRNPSLEKMLELIDEAERLVEGT